MVRQKGRSNISLEVRKGNLQQYIVGMNGYTE